MTVTITNQTAKLAQIKASSSGTDSVTGDVVALDFAQCTTATSANAGSASSLPATPAGYVTIVIGTGANAQVVKVPYYAV